jgi:hypothetical protein
MLKKINDNRGSALVMVISMMFIVTILIFALVSLVISEFKLVNSEEDSQQAYYLARSGAAATADWIEKQGFQTVLDTFGGDNGQTTNWQSLEEERPGEFKVKVQIYEEDANRLTIESKGRFDGNQRTVRLTMLPDAVSFNSILDTAIFSEGKITAGNKTKIYGTLGSNLGSENPFDMANNSTFEGDLLLAADMEDTMIDQVDDILVEGFEAQQMETSREYPMPVFPVFPEIETDGSDSNYKGDLPNNTTSIAYSEEAIRYDEMNLNKDLTIDTGDSADDLIEIRVRVLNLKNNKITLNGEGTLNLYVDESINSNGQGAINYYSDTQDKKDNLDRLMIYYAGSTDISLSGQEQIVGHLYSKTANISLKGSGNIFGHIVSGGGEINITGNAYEGESADLVRMIYAPQTNINFSGGGDTFSGSIIGNSVSLANNMIVRQFQIPTENLPFQLESVGKFKKDYWH